MKIKSFILLCFFIISHFYLQGQNIDSLEQLLPQKLNKDKVDVLNQLSSEYCYEGNLQKSRDYADQAILLATEINYIKGLAEATKNTAEYFYELEIFDNSAEYYLKSFDYYQKLNDKENMSYCANVTGICYRKISEYDTAIKYHFLSLQIAEEIQNDNRISAAVYSLGLLYHSIEDFDNALQYYNRSLEYDILNNDSLGMAKSYTNLGLIYKKKNDIKTTIELYNKALDLYKKLNDNLGIAIIINNFGFLYQANKQYTKSIEYFYKSIYYEKLANNNQGIASSFSSIGDTYVLMNELDSALKYQLFALELTKDHDIKKYIYESLSQIYSKKEDYKKALTYHELFVAQKDTIFKLENLKQIADMQTKYQTKKKEEEISELTIQKKIQEINLKKNKIIIYSTIGGLILLIILIFVVLSAYRNKQKINILLMQQNAQILQQKEEITTQRDEIKTQKIDIETKHLQIKASISYAKRIQEAVLPNENFIQTILPQHFILFKPRDDVSGDFYFIKKINNLILIAAADCTGHGVPGAFMSMLGVALLNELIRNTEIQTPAQLLNELRTQIKSSLQQTGRKNEQQDGMDIAFCVINKNTYEMSFAGAYNPCWIFRTEQITDTDNNSTITNTKLITIDADRQPVGIFVKEKQFSEKQFILQKDDVFYIFSDGYESQFGGEKNEKFKVKRLRELLTNICLLPLDNQKEILLQKLATWQKDMEQTDDILIIGVKI